MKDKIFKTFLRVTTSGNFIPEIDGLRFLSILFVVLSHLKVAGTKFGGYSEGYLEMLQANPVFYFLTHGKLGVNLFFVISGFVLGLPFTKAALNRGSCRVDLKKYYLRRLTRLEPPFLIVMTGFFFLHGFFSHEGLAQLFPHFLASITYSHVFVYGQWSTINPVSWSLETEVQFYLLAPVISFFFYISAKGGLRYFILLAVMILSGFLSPELPRHLSKSVLNYVPHFLTGFLIAETFHQHQNFWRKKAVIYDFLGILGLVNCFLLATYLHWLSPFFFALSAVAVFLGGFKGCFLNRLLRNKIFTSIGGMCYTIYLLHYPFLHVCTGALKPFLSGTNFFLDYLILLILLGPILLVIAGSFYLLCEKPFMYSDWPQKTAVWIKQKLNYKSSLKTEP